jgi:cation transport regulator
VVNIALFVINVLVGGWWFYWPLIGWGIGFGVHALAHAQEIYKEAFNSAEEHYGEESRAHRVAWSAVENKYEKNDQGNWIQEKS